MSFKFKGCLGYNPYLDLKNKTRFPYNPLGFAWTWFHDIFDSKKEAAFWFKNVMEQSWAIDKWAQDLSPLNKDGKDICFVTNIDELQKYAKFDMEELYQKGIVNVGYENIAKYGKPYLDKGYAGRIDVCLLVEVINRGDYSNKELEKWIGAFFKEYGTDRDVLETCIKEKIKSEHKPLVKRVYMRFFKKYMEE